MNAGAAPNAYAYQGPEALQADVQRALQRVVDPEVAMNIVDLGLVYRVDVQDDAVTVVMTMTSAACPMADVIFDDVHRELAQALGQALRIEVEVVWEPAWSTDRMSPRAKALMGW